MEEAPVGDHWPTGAAENAVKTAQGKLRVLKNEWHYAPGQAERSEAKAKRSRTPRGLTMDLPGALQQTLSGP